MLRLVQTNFATARQHHARPRSPLLFRDFAEAHTLLPERCHQRAQVVAHEVHLVLVVLLCGMKRRLGRGQGKDQPAVSRVDGAKSQDVAEECAVGLRIL